MWVLDKKLTCSQTVIIGNLASKGDFLKMSDQQTSLFKI